MRCTINDKSHLNPIPISLIPTVGYEEVSGECGFVRAVSSFSECLSGSTIQMLLEF